MVSFAKLHIIRQGIRKKYKNIGLENFLLFIIVYTVNSQFWIICELFPKVNNPAVMIIKRKRNTAIIHLWNEFSKYPRLAMNCILIDNHLFHNLF
jgi:hypothetical protein